MSQGRKESQRNYSNDVAFICIIVVLAIIAGQAIYEQVIKLF